MIAKLETRRGDDMRAAILVMTTRGASNHRRPDGSSLQRIPGNPADAGLPGYDQLVYGTKMMIPDRHRIGLYYTNVNKRPTI
jgi:hypothetical protein